MMATVTANSIVLTYISLGRELPKASLVASDVSRPGVNGHAIKQAGRRGAVAHRVASVDVLTANLATFLTNVAKQQGYLATVVDDFGLTRQNVLVMRATAREPQKIGAEVGGLNGGDVLVVVDYEMLDTNPTVT